MTQALVFDPSTVEPEIGAPPPDRVMSGTPQFRTWSLEETGDGLYAGIWEATPGKWRIAYHEWEYFHILSGLFIVTEDGGTETHLKAGDSMILKPGFKGTWEVLETTRKEYVIRV